METLRDTQNLPLLTHRGWLPETDWPEFERLRLRWWDHLHTPHKTEQGVWQEYADRREEYEAEIADAMRNPENGFETAVADRDLEPSKNELANARAEERIWKDVLFERGMDVKYAVEENWEEWQGSLGNVDGLMDFAQRAAEMERYIAQIAQRFPDVAEPEAFEAITEALRGMPAEATRIHRLYTWLEITTARPLHLGYAYYEDKSAVPVPDGVRRPKAANHG